MHYFSLFFTLYVAPFLIGSLLIPREVPAPLRWWAGIGALGLVIAESMAFGLCLEGAVLCGATCLLGIPVLLGRHKTALQEWRRPDTPYLVTGLLLAFLMLGVYATVLLQPVVVWDGLVIWYGKVRSLLACRPLGEVQSPLYPNLGPALWALGMKVAGGREEMGRLVFPTAYFATAFSLTVFFSGRPGRLVMAVLVPLLAAWLYTDPEMTSFDIFSCGYQDGVLSVLVAAVAVCWVKGMAPSQEERGSGCESRPWLAAGVLLAGAACQVKAEGLVAGLCLLAAFLALALVPPRTRRRDLVLMALGFTLLAVLWPATLRLRGLDPSDFQSGAFTLNGILRFYERADRLAPILAAWKAYAWANRWMLAASMAGSLAALVLCRAARKPILFLWTAAVLHTAAVWLVFMTTRLPFEWHLQTAFYRLTFQHRSLHMVLIALTAAHLLKRVERHWLWQEEDLRTQVISPSLPAVRNRPRKKRRGVR